MTCGYLQTGSTKWSKGVVSESSVLDNILSIKCSSDHLTLFTLIETDSGGSEIPPPSSSSPMLMIGLVIGGVLIIIALIVIFKPKKR